MPPHNATVPSIAPQQPPRPIDPGVRIGHAHLKVADLDRALAFYSGVLGFELQQRFGDQAAFLAAGGYHHHIGLNTWESKGGEPPAPGTTGLFHIAILYPTRAALADALRRLLAAGVPLEGASDHGVNEALYLRDPDGNGIELYPRERLFARHRDGCAGRPHVLVCDRQRHPAGRTVSHCRVARRDPGGPRAEVTAEMGAS